MIYSAFLIAFAVTRCFCCVALPELNEYDLTPTFTTLHNGESMPLVGTGVGNLQHELIPQVLRSMMEKHKKVILIDTAKASRNEELIAESVGQALNEAEIDDDDVIHIVTKVWYTHLGYERTKLSVDESLKELSKFPGPNPVHVHVLLHWPRCSDEIPWMNCKEEERNLPQYVKAAGPPPHTYPGDTAWRESWKALEDIYKTHQTLNANVKVASIGVSNFNLDDLNALVSNSRIKPHMIQGNVWDVIFNKDLMDLVKKENIFFQAYNVMNGIVRQSDKSPEAFTVLRKMANILTTRMELIHEGSDMLMHLSESMIVSAWLLQQGVGIIPRALDYDHQWENAPESLQFVPILYVHEWEMIYKAIEALMKGEDLTVEATFTNNMGESSINVHWVDLGTGLTNPVIENLEPGDSMTINTHPGHRFRCYDEKNGHKREFDVQAHYGERSIFTIDEF